MDLEKVVRAQQSELLLHALTKEASNVEEQIDTALDNWKKFFRDDEKLRKNRDMDWINTGRAVLTAYGLGRGEVEADKYLENVKKYDPELGQVLDEIVNHAKLTMASRKNYLDMTVEEFATLRTIMDRLWTESKRKMEVGLAEEREKLAEVAGKLTDRLTKLTGDAPRLGETQAITKAEEGWIEFLGDVALTNRVQHWCNALDETLTRSGEPGIFTKYIWRRIDVPTEKYLAARKQHLTKLAALFTSMYARQPKRYSKDFNYTFGARTGDASSEIIGHLLHLGNPSNKQRHLIPRGWATVDPETGAIDYSVNDKMLADFIQKGWITKEMMTLVQEAWDAINEITEQYVQKAHKDKTGDYLELVPPESFTLTWPDGETVTYRGGYAPSKIDRMMSAIGYQIETMEDLRQDVRNQRPQSPNGFTKKRVSEEPYARSMNPMIILEAIDNELRYAVLGPAIDDVLKVMNDKEFSKALNRFDPKARDKRLLPWLNAVASQRTSKSSMSTKTDRALTTIRNNVSLNSLSLGLVNATQNLTGIFQAWKAIPGKHLAKALAMYVANIRPGYNALSVWIASQDATMETRMAGQVRDPEQQMRRMFENPSLFNRAVDMAKPVWYILQTITQNVVDTVTWYGRYAQTMEQMGAAPTDLEAHNEAVARARSAVTLTQHSQRPENVAAFEVATPFNKLFIQFVGYANLLANLTGSEWKKTMRSDMGLPAKYANLVFTYLLVWAIPLAVGEMIKKAYEDDLEPKEDQSWANFLLWDLFTRPQLSAGAQAVPYYGQLGRLAMDAADDRPYNDRLQVAPAVQALEKGVLAGAELVKKWPDFFEQGEVSGRVIRDGLGIFSALWGIPTKPVTRALSYQAQVESGKVTPTSEYDYFRGLATGLASPESKR